MATPASAGSTKAYESKQPLSEEELRKMHAYWRAANYLSVGQIYLYANPLLHEPLKFEHIKPRLLGHWGTTPGLNFIYVHFNRLIKKHDLNVIYVAGPGHGGPAGLQVWPMIILRTPQGWTGQTMVDGKPVEDTWRAHQVPVTNFVSHPDHVKILEEWLRSYSPEELFDRNGKLIAELEELAPSGARRMGANPHANGGLLLKDLRMPDFRGYAVAVPKPGAVDAEATHIQGLFIRDVLKLNGSNFRIFSPDETASNRWAAVFDVTDRCSMQDILKTDVHVSRDGRVMEVLSEHMCQGWLEGYLLTGRHGFFSCY